MNKKIVYGALAAVLIVIISLTATIFIQGGSKKAKVTSQDSSTTQTANSLSPFLSAAAAGDEEKLKGFLSDKSLKTDEVDKDGNTALHLAVMNNKYPTAKLLLEKGFSLDIKNKDGKTPLDIKDKEGNLLYKIVNNGDAALFKSIVDKLLPGKANKLEDSNPLMDTDAEGNTLIHLAIKKGNREIASYLADKGMSLDKQNKDNKTALALATEKKYFFILAKYYYSIENYGECIKYATYEITQEDSRNYDAYYLNGLAHFESGKLSKNNEEKINYFKRAAYYIDEVKKNSTNVKTDENVVAFVQSELAKSSTAVGNSIKVGDRVYYKPWIGQVKWMGTVTEARNENGRRNLTVKLLVNGVESMASSKSVQDRYFVPAITDADSNWALLD